MINGFFHFLKKLVERHSKNYEKTLFKKFGNNSNIGRNCTFTHKTISIGNFVQIGNNCTIQSAHGYIDIGNHVMLGPGVNIHGGNHETAILGYYMDEIQKEFGVDPNIIIEDDVWIGANAIILKGVTIREGSVIGAGSVVTKDVGSYTIVAGNPAKKISVRFNEDEIKKHKSLLEIRRNR